jgi:UDP-N-acetylmuramoyl-L-alanyl-D-glutamate--2,6-diaminopimelate ligase
LIDRREAIAAAIAAARAGDTVLLAGKGHETHQIIGTERTRFDDREEARAAIASIAGGA